MRSTLAHQRESGQGERRRRDRRGFRRFFISDEEWRKHSEVEHQAYLIANLNKLLLDADMPARIPTSRFSRRRSNADLTKKLSNSLVLRYGRFLRRDLYEEYNPLPSRKEAEAMEEALARRLRLKGHGVWWG